MEKLRERNMKKSISIATGLLSLLLLAGRSNQSKSNSTASQESSKSSVVSSKKKTSKKNDSDKMDDGAKSKSSSTENSESSSSSNENSNSSESSKSSQSSTSSTNKVATKKMNFDQIQNGDYSSLVGNWKLIKAVGQHKDVTDRTDSTLTITPSLLKTSSIELSKDGLTDSNDTHPIEVKRVGDALNILNADDHDSQYNWSVTFYPANSQSVVIDGEKQAPVSKNLIAIWVSSNNYTEVFEEE